jgi:hypothetical protein
MLGHARTAITLDVYTHLFERARHAADVRAAMAASRFAQILVDATATEPWLTETRPPAGGSVGLAEPSVRSSAAASVARRVSAELLDHGLTNALRPRSPRPSPQNTADFQGFRWS